MIILIKVLIRRNLIKKFMNISHKMEIDSGNIIKSDFGKFVKKIKKKFNDKRKCKNFSNEYYEN